MSINYQILGQPGRDNALFVEINTGQSIHRLQFDCGEACLRDLPVSQIQAIDALLFSHFHIDHVAGFDAFLRSNYDRADRPVSRLGTGRGDRDHPPPASGRDLEPRRGRTGRVRGDRHPRRSARLLGFPGPRAFCRGPCARRRSRSRAP